MDDLPTPASQGNNQINTNTTNNLPRSGISPRETISQSGIGSIGKEVESGSLGLEQPIVKDVSGQEIELPKEVAAAGVTQKPTAVQLPQAVTQMGVTPVGQMGLPQAPAAALPLTETQIVLGLKQSITSSWRWLAEWCIRKLKQLHKKIHA